MFARYRRERERDDAELISELRWQWRSACTATSLSHMIYTPTGPTRAVPMMGQVNLGPPISFAVRMRPGQRLADFEAAAPWIAPTMNAAELRIVPFVPHWVRVILVPVSHGTLPGPWSEPDVA